MSKKTATTLGTYKGLPILEEKPECRGMEGGFAKTMSAVGSHETPVGEPDWLGIKVIPKGHRYDLVEEEDEDGEMFPKGWIFVQIYKVVGVGYSTEEAIGEGIHAAMEAVAKAEALKKAGQQAFSLPDPEDLPSAEGTRDEHGDLIDRVNDAFGGDNVREIRTGVPDDEGASELE